MSFLAHLPELCDITFMVGPDKELVCAVRAVLAARSPVFLEKLYMDDKRFQDSWLMNVTIVVSRSDSSLSRKGIGDRMKAKTNVATARLMKRFNSPLMGFQVGYVQCPALSSHVVLV